jgi:FlaA1/EpsC-like NDP-sugar epimerase
VDRLLITGATGSLGGELTARFARRYQVIAQGRDAARLARLAARHPEITTVRGDLRSAAVRDAVAGSGSVIHAAAQKYADRAEQDCYGTVDVNVNCTHELAELAAQSGVRRFVLVGSDKAVSPAGVYAATKYLAERLVLELAEKSPSTSFAVCRLSNIFGSSGSVVRRWLDACRAAEPTIAVTDPAMTRFMFPVAEAAGVIEYALESGVSGDVVIPKLRSVAVGDLLRLFDGVRVNVVGPRPGEQAHELLHPGGVELGRETQRYYVLYKNAPDTVQVPRLNSERAARVPTEELRAWLEEVRRNAND